MLKGKMTKCDKFNLLRCGKTLQSHTLQVAKPAQKEKFQFNLGQLKTKASCFWILFLCQLFVVRTHEP
jgi:hypothetical protein